MHTYEAIRERAEELYRAKNPNGDFLMTDPHQWWVWMSAAKADLRSSCDERKRPE